MGPTYRGVNKDSWMDLSVLMYQCHLTCKTKNATTQRLRGMGRGSAAIVRQEVLFRESARLSLALRIE